MINHSEFADRVRSIQNTNKSLRWGCDLASPESTDYTCICVGHSVVRDIHFIVIDKEGALCDASSKELVKLLPPNVSTGDAVYTVIQKLKEWYPANRGV